MTPGGRSKRSRSGASGSAASSARQAARVPAAAGEGAGIMRVLRIQSDEARSVARKIRGEVLVYTCLNGNQKNISKIFSENPKVLQKPPVNQLR
jgi:hypothetical protein